MRRLVAVLCVATLVLTACGRADDESAATTPPAADVTALTSTTAVPPTTSPSTVTTAAAQPTSTTAAPPEPDTVSRHRPILVSNDDGVFQILGDGSVTHLVDGAVAFAIDDGMGGLLYQLERGRDWGDFFGDPTPGFDTTVYWIPAGESSPRPLLVPTPGAGHTLSLQDAFAVADSFAVVYIRHEGEEPPFDGNMADTLRVYDVGSQAVTELGRVRGWEWLFGSASGGGGLVATAEYPLFGGGCRLYEASGPPAALPGYPTLTDECYGESANCPTACSISSDGEHHAYAEWSVEREEWSLTVVTSDGVTHEVVATHRHPLAAGFVGALDVADGFLLVNRSLHENPPIPALILPPTASDRSIELPLAGEARFATAPVQLGSTPLTAGGPAYYRYGDDGVFRVVNGVATQLLDEPVAHVWDDHMGGLIISDVTNVDIRHLRRGEATPLTLERSAGYAYARFTGLLDG